MIIALTVVAFGTSAPELIVSVGAALRGVPELAIGNIVGSNIANILLVLGLPAIIAPLGTSGKSAGRDLALVFGASVLVAILSWNQVIGWWEGLVMVILLMALSWARLISWPAAMPRRRNFTRKNLRSSKAAPRRKR